MISGLKAVISSKHKKDGTVYFTLLGTILFVFLERVKNMLDIKFLRENPEIVKENIKKKFQDAKLPLVDEVIVLDEKVRELKLNGDNLRSEKNNISASIGQLMRDKKIDEAEKMKARVVEINQELLI